MITLNRFSHVHLTCILAFSNNLPANENHPGAMSILIHYKIDIKSNFQISNISEIFDLKYLEKPKIMEKIVLYKCWCNTEICMIHYKSWNEIIYTVRPVFSVSEKNLYKIAVVITNFAKIRSLYECKADPFGGGTRFSSRRNTIQCLDFIRIIENVQAQTTIFFGPQNN